MQVHRKPKPKPYFLCFIFLLCLTKPLLANRFASLSMLKEIEKSNYGEGISIQVLSGAKTVGIEAGNIFIEEVKQAREQKYNLVFILPGGSTPVPMFEYIIERWNKEGFDLSQVLFFGIGEYIGLDLDHPCSYRSFFYRYFFNHLLGKPSGIKAENIFLPKGGRDRDEAQKNLPAFRDKLIRYLKDPSIKVVLFGGIGSETAHVAFNDFCDEEMENIEESKRQKYAVETLTRIVSLSKGTRLSKRRYFADSLESVPKYAVSIGFREILGADRVIILATDETKKRAISSVFADNPSYKIPASLLRLFEKDIVFLVSLDAYEPVNSDVVRIEGLAAVHAALPERASLLAEQEYSPSLHYNVHQVSIPKNQCVLVVEDEFNSKIAKALERYVEPGKVLIVPSKPSGIQFGEQRSISKASKGSMYLPTLAARSEQARMFREYLEKYEPEVIFFPAKLYSNDHYQELRTIIDERNKYNPDYRPTLVLYDNPFSRLHRYNYLLPLTQDDIDLQRKALTHHLSQVRRTNFIEITRARALEGKNDLVALGENMRSDFIGLEAYEKVGLSQGVLHYNHIDKEYEARITYELNMNERDLLVVASPHPDDAEIGAGGLLIRAGRQGIPTLVFNATAGYHTAIRTQDVLDQPPINNQSWAQAMLRREAMPLSPSGLVEDPKLRGEVRLAESLLALRTLNPAISMEFLDLKFYDKRAGILKEDKETVLSKLTNLFYKVNPRGGQIYLLIPAMKDQHESHRVVSRLFLEQLKVLSQNKPFAQFTILFYRTPWTGGANLYLYSGFGNVLHSEALIGAERIRGKASSNRDLLRGFLKPQRAWALRVFSF